MIEHLPEGLNDHGTLVRKRLFQLGELTSAMGQTVAANQGSFIRGITREGIRHHQWLAPVSLPGGQQRLQVLPSMGAPGKIETDRPSTLLGYQRRRVHPGTLLSVLV